MSLRRPVCLGVILSAVLSLPALAQTDTVPWTNNLDAAKAEARQSGRLVLIHFWTESCGPCKALDRNVFSQPEVSGAIQAQFVPVKLNADDNPATAASMGINRVPTDIVITPDGEVISKVISPPTPMAYIAELSHTVSKYTGRSGQTYAAATTQAPMQPQINMAYAGLQSGTMTTPALAQANQSVAINQFAAAKNGLAPSPYLPSQSPANASMMPPQPQGGMFVPPGGGAMASAPMPSGQMPAAGLPGGQPMAYPPQPAMVNNQYAAPQGMGQYSAPAQQPFAQQPAASQMDPNANRYGVAPQVPPTYLNASVPPAAGAGTVPPMQGQMIPNQFAAAAPAAATYPTTQPQAQAPTQAGMLGGSPDTRQLPPGAMPLGFDGYCPVSMRNSNLTKWVPGNPKYGVQHRGRTYWFAGATEMAQFWANPDIYAPALSGLDPVMFLEHHQQVPGTREHSVDYDNTFYMFASEVSLQQFQTNPKKYVTGVREAMGIKGSKTLR